MLNMLSFFSGIGAFEKALDKSNVPYNLVNYCEIDKHASKSYSAVHNVPESLNLGDISKVDTSKITEKIDLVTYGFPCQDISLAGKQKGLFNEDGTQTRSGLFFEALRIIEDVKPKVAIAENVKNLVSKKFSEQFEIVLNSLEQAGYNNYWQVLNAKDYGVPQNRERVFIVSIRKDIDKGFKFPKPFELELRLKDLLESEVDEKYYLSESQMGKIVNWKAQQKPFERVLGDNSVSPTLTARGAGENHSGMIIYSPQLNETTNLHLYVKENTKKGYAEAVEGDSINFEQPNSKTRRGRVGKQVAQTLTTAPQLGVVINEGQSGLIQPVDRKYKEHGKNREVHIEFKNDDCSHALRTSIIPLNCTDLRIRKLTPLECWRLMGFDDDDFYKAEKVNSNTQLYKQAGNSIVVDVLVYLFEELLEVFNVERVEEKVIIHNCSGLIDLAQLKEKEPELYEELLADYPCEKGTYVYKNF